MASAGRSQLVAHVGDIPPNAFVHYYPRESVHKKSRTCLDSNCYTTVTLKAYGYTQPRARQLSLSDEKWLPTSHGHAILAHRAR